MSNNRGSEETARSQEGPGTPLPSPANAEPALPEYRDEHKTELFWQHAAPRREPIRTRWFLPTVAILLVLNVPWYLPSESAARTMAGLPLWCWMALATSLLLSIVTATAALTSWRDED